MYQLLQNLAIKAINQNGKDLTIPGDAVKSGKIFHATTDAFSKAWVFRSLN